MSDLQIQDVIAQMRVLSQSGRAEDVASVRDEVRETGLDFATTLRDSIRAVNSIQKTSRDLQERFELGDANVNLPDVMVAMNKSSLAFEGVNQVRNRLLSAYQEVMSMQV